MTKSMHERHGNYFWLLLLCSLAYGAMMLTIDGRPLTQLYGLSPYHRYQAGALLQGHFCLADSIDTLRPGLAWHNGQMQQVWGLGVAIWLVPFQAVWRLFGGDVFPDRIALAVAFALLAFYAGCTGLRIIRQRQCAIGLGLIWLVALCPAVWTLARSSQLIFEETVLYAILVSLGVFISVIRVALFGSRADYLLCCVLGAFAAWVRPTHAIYGITGVVVSSLILWRRNRNWKDLALGNAGIFLSLGLLAWSNYVRFGSPSEFGHRLTVSTGSMVYLTRFGNPFRKATPSGAAEELLGALFFNANVHDAGAFAESSFPGQSSATRWRRLYLTAFDPSWAGLCLIAIVGASLWIVKQRQRNQTTFWQQPENSLNVSLLLWSGVSVVALGGFYLYYPAIASRYLLDFAPALTGLAMSAWFLIPPRWSRFALPLLAGWLLYEIAAAKIPASQQRSAKGRQPEFVLPHASGTPLKDFQGTYTASHHPTATGIAFNGSGWEADTGFAADVVCLAVDEPEYLELRVSQRRGLNGLPARKDVYRARIGTVSLPVREVKDEGEELKVVFDVARKIRTRQQDEMLFLCFSEGYDAEDRSSERVLHSVRWR